MRADNSEHVSPGAPLEGLLRNAEVNNLNLLVPAAIENILRFNVTMTYIMVVQVANCSDEFLDDLFELVLRERRALGEVGGGGVLHDEIGVSVVEVQRPILEDGGVVELLQIDEALFQLHQVLLLDLELFHRVHLARLLVHALVDASVGPLPQLLLQLVLLLEGVRREDALLLRGQFAHGLAVVVQLGGSGLASGLLAETVELDSELVGLLADDGHGLHGESQSFQSLVAD